MKVLAGRVVMWAVAKSQSVHSHRYGDSNFFFKSIIPFVL